MEDVILLTYLPLFGRENTMAIVLDTNNQVHLKYLMMVMTASRSSKKSTYTTRLLFYDEGDGSCSKFMVEAFLAY